MEENQFKEEEPLFSDHTFEDTLDLDSGADIEQLPL